MYVKCEIVSFVVKTRHVRQGGPRFANCGAYHGERVERYPITGVWGRASASSKGRAPGGASLPEAESFSSIFVQKGPKV